PQGANVGLSGGSHDRSWRHTLAGDRCCVRGGARCRPRLCRLPMAPSSTRCLYPRGQRRSGAQAVSSGEIISPFVLVRLSLSVLSPAKLLIKLIVPAKVP